MSWTHLEVEQSTDVQIFSYILNKKFQMVLKIPLLLQVVFASVAKLNKWTLNNIIITLLTNICYSPSIKRSTSFPPRAQADQGVSKQQNISTFCSALSLSIYNHFKLLSILLVFSHFACNVLDTCFATLPLQKLKNLSEKFKSSCTHQQPNPRKNTCNPFQITSCSCLTFLWYQSTF